MRSNRKIIQQIIFFHDRNRQEITFAMPSTVRNVALLCYHKSHLENAGGGNPA